MEEVTLTMEEADIVEILEEASEEVTEEAIGVGTDLQIPILSERKQIKLFSMHSRHMTQMSLADIAKIKVMILNIVSRKL